MTFFTPGVGQNIALLALHTPKNHAFLIFVFMVHSVVLQN